MPFPILFAVLVPLLSWSRLPDIPDAEGFAGVFAGTSGRSLVLAGGANFPAGRPWEGGAKVWHDRIFVLAPAATGWHEAGRLAAPLGYGASVTHDDRVVCIGGSDADSHHASVIALRWDGRAIQTTPLPPLPRPLAMHCGAVIGDRVFIAGGTSAPDAVETERVFLSLDLSQPAGGWRNLPPWPGPGRILATAGVASGRFHLLGGADLVGDIDGKPQRVWLQDAYRYDPQEGWRRLPDLPRPAVAAPSPAPLVGGKVLAILGGDDGSGPHRDPASHPGFRRDVLGFDVALGRWHWLGDMPMALVTTVPVPWAGGIIIPGGESRPGVRSRAVWCGRPEASHPDPGPPP